MARIRFSLLVPFFAAASLVTFAMAEAPEDTYLNADMLMSKAKSQESNRFYKSATETIQKAQAALTELQKSNPDWHPDWIERKMAGIREMTERLAPLVTQFPDSQDPGLNPNTRGHSVAPSEVKKTSSIDEALKPSISLSSGVAAPVEVMAGSVHERYLKNDPAYLAQVQERRLEAARRQQEALERQQALKAEARSHEKQLNELRDRQRQEEEALARLEKTTPKAIIPSHSENGRKAVNEELRREPSVRRVEVVEKVRKDEVDQGVQLREQQSKVEEARRNFEREQARIRAEQARIEQEQTEAMRKQEAARAEAERARIQEEETRKKRAIPRTAPRESSGRSRFRIG